MNIFTFLNLRSNHRSEKKIFQLAKHYADVVEKNKTFPMIGQAKYDGCFCAIAVKKGYAKAFSRTGKHFTNLSHVELKYNGYADGIYICEITNARMTQQEFSGCINPNRVEILSIDKWDKVITSSVPVFFDYLTLDEFEAGKSDTKYMMRLAKMNELLKHTDARALSVVIEDRESVFKFFKDMLLSDMEGACFKPNVGWEAGHKNYRTMKMVKAISLDLRCIRYEEGKGKWKGMVGNLFFEHKGETIKASLGKGWTDVERKAMFESGSCVGEIYQVYAMEKTIYGKLRNPKVGEHRHDKCDTD